jgi:hypothetical protein
VDIYLNSTGKPLIYDDPNIPYYYYAAYDKNGDLFADGASATVDELPHGGKTLKEVTLDRRITPGSMQWDGTHLAIADIGKAKGPTPIDQFAIAGSTGKFVGETPLKTYENQATYLPTQLWIQGTAIVGPGAGTGSPNRWLYFWPYPRGGKASKIVKPPGYDDLYGAAVSVAR